MKSDMVWYGTGKAGRQTYTKCILKDIRIYTATYCTHFLQPLIMHLKYLVNLIYFPFPWEQGLAGEHLSEYASYGPQIKGGGVLTLS
jgi:hypothetical protein